MSLSILKSGNHPLSCLTTCPNLAKAPSKIAHLCTSIKNRALWSDTSLQNRVIRIETTDKGGKTPVLLQQELTDFIKKIKRKLGGNLPLNCIEPNPNSDSKQFLKELRSLVISLETYLALGTEFDQLSVGADLLTMENTIKSQMSLVERIRYSHEFEKYIRIEEAKNPLFYHVENTWSDRTWVEGLKYGAARGAALTCIVIDKIWGPSSGTNFSSIVSTCCKILLKPALVGLGLIGGFLIGSKTNLRVLLLLIAGLSFAIWQAATFEQGAAYITSQNALFYLCVAGVFKLAELALMKSGTKQAEAIPHSPQVGAVQVFPLSPPAKALIENKSVIAPLEIKKPTSSMAKALPQPEATAPAPVKAEPPPSPPEAAAPAPVKADIPTPPPPPPLPPKTDANPPTRTTAFHDLLAQIKRRGTTEGDEAKRITALETVLKTPASALPPECTSTLLKMTTGE